MSKSNTNLDPNTKRAFEEASKGHKNKKLGIDANSDERIYDLGKNLKKKRGFWRFVIVLIIFLLIFDAFFMKGELIINFLKNLFAK